MIKKTDWSLYLVTDSRIIGDKNLLSIIEPSLKGGVTMVQYRDKNRESKEMFQIALELRKLTRKFGIPLIINDRLDIALAVDADGIHLGQKDLPIDIVRKILGKDKIIGITIANEGQAKNANSMDVDYMIAAPIYRTNTDLDERGLIGPIGLESIMKVAEKPIVAAGGVSHKNTHDLMDLGIAGIVVINPIMTSDDPQLAAEKFIKLLKPSRI